MKMQFKLFNFAFINLKLLIMKKFLLILIPVAMLSCRNKAGNNNDRNTDRNLNNKEMVSPNTSKDTTRTRRDSTSYIKDTTTSKRDTITRKMK